MFSLERSELILWRNWVLASTVGWTVGLAVGVAVGEAVIGAVVGAITGIALVWLFRQPVPELSSASDYPEGNEAEAGAELPE